MMSGGGGEVLRLSPFCPAVKPAQAQVQVRARVHTTSRLLPGAVLKKAKSTSDLVQAAASVRVHTTSRLLLQGAGLKKA